MTTKETLHFFQQLRTLYERFHITEALMEMWAHELKTVEASDLQGALRRYIVSGAREDQPPTLQTILDHADAVRRDRRRQEVTIERQTLEATDLGAILATASRRVSERDANWARQHVAMFSAGVAKPGREAEAVAWCEQKALEFPEDAEDWLNEAESYHLILEDADVL